MFVRHLTLLFCVFALSLASIAEANDMQPASTSGFSQSEVGSRLDWQEIGLSLMPFGAAHYNKEHYKTGAFFTATQTWALAAYADQRNLANKYNNEIEANKRAAALQRGDQALTVFAALWVLSSAISISAPEDNVLSAPGSSLWSHADNRDSDYDIQLLPSHSFQGLSIQLSSNF